MFKKLYIFLAVAIIFALSACSTDASSSISPTSTVITTSTPISSTSPSIILQPEQGCTVIQSDGGIEVTTNEGIAISLQDLGEYYPENKNIAFGDQTITTRTQSSYVGIALVNSFWIGNCYVGNILVDTTALRAENNRLYKMVSPYEFKYVYVFEENVNGVNMQVFINIDPPQE